MITWTRSAKINQGQQMAAIEWALRVSAYVNDKYGTSISVQRNVAGPSNQIHWVVNYPNLAALDEITAALQQDEGYAQMLAETYEAAHFDGHSVVDSIYQTIG